MRSARILVVDDEPTGIEILDRYLKARGHRVDGAVSADAAIAALKRGAYDLVLLDVVLPGRTGLQALAEIKSLTPAPVHLMSGLSDSELREDARLLGAAGFFAKPFELAAVLAVVDAL